jgi:hypothetical protein
MFLFVVDLEPEVRVRLKNNNKKSKNKKPKKMEAKEKEETKQKEKEKEKKRKYKYKGEFAVRYQIPGTGDLVPVATVDAPKILSEYRKHTPRIADLYQISNLEFEHLKQNRFSVTFELDKQNIEDIEKDEDHPKIMAEMLVDYDDDGNYEVELVSRPAPGLLAGKLLRLTCV